MECISFEAIDKIQAILDCEFSKDDSINGYWTYESPIEIDVYPKGHCPKCGNKYVNKDFGMCEKCCEKHFEKLG
ncbi:hypothetical protein [Schinkia azotoformans]|nr:hypothetical protein [Schinkia azotoformans]MEC1714729.1 hypothetical protein [Schinkia azotoformans]MEC1757515.1 hypothetical protein [Schinkia azotoformans]